MAGARAAAFATSVWTALAVFAVALVIGGVVWPGGADADVPPGAPQKLELPGRDRATPVVAIRLQGEVLDPPRDVRQVGWWRGSALPGARAGQTVITGHTVHTGGGSLNRLDRLEPGQRVVVRTRPAEISYRVTDVRTYSRAGLAKHAQALFGQDHGDGRLVLVTCSDWNGTSYDSNLVAVAERYAARERDTDPGT